MQVQQKNVTTVNLHMGNDCSFVLHRRGQDFQLSVSSGDDVVHILMDTQDLQRLRRELITEDVAQLSPVRLPRRPAQCTHRWIRTPSSGTRWTGYRTTERRSSAPVTTNGSAETLPRSEGFPIWAHNEWPR